MPRILTATARALTLLALVALTALAAPAHASETNVVGGYAVHGHDVVAYFTDGKPTPGDDRFVHEHGGAKYRFASAANRDRFAADPAAARELLESAGLQTGDAAMVAVANVLLNLDETLTKP